MSEPTAGELLAAETQTRAAAAEVVDFNDETGVVDARLITYEHRAQIAEDMWEVFTRGAFEGAVAEPHRVKVSNQQHDMSVTIGRAIELRDEQDGLYGRLKIADTSAGRDVLTLLRDGVLDELSIEFVPQKRHMKVERLAGESILVRHNRATLRGISPVSRGAYGQGSKVLQVRAQTLLSETDAQREREAQEAAAHLAAVRKAELDRLRGLTA